MEATVQWWLIGLETLRSQDSERIIMWMRNSRDLEANLLLLRFEPDIYITAYHAIDQTTILNRGGRVRLKELSYKYMY